MFKKFIESFDTDVRLVVVVDNYDYLNAFYESVDCNNCECAEIALGVTVVIMNMKYKEYRKFMKRLQAKGRNLRQSENGLYDTLI